jgi:hypothetical protein
MGKEIKCYPGTNLVVAECAHCGKEIPRREDIMHSPLDEEVEVCSKECGEGWDEVYFTPYDRLILGLEKEGGFTINHPDAEHYFFTEVLYPGVKAYFNYVPEHSKKLYNGYVDNYIVADSADQFRKISTCILRMKLPEKYIETAEIIAQLKRLGTEEGQKIARECIPGEFPYTSEQHELYKDG